MATNTVNYDEIKSIVNESKTLIIDVRAPEEVQSTGKIGDSINIPVSEIADALKESPEMFQEKYGKPLPNLNDPIVFHCLKGARAQRAWEAAESLGYKNAKYYPGSYLEWSSKN